MDIGSFIGGCIQKLDAKSVKRILDGAAA